MKKSILMILVIIALIFSYKTFVAKKNHLSKKDKNKYWDKGYKEFNYHVINESSRRNSEGHYLEPEFTNISIPSELLKKFTIKALRNNFYDYYDFDNIKKTFFQITKNDNWSWSYNDGGDYSFSQKELIVNIHNYHRSRKIKWIVVTIMGIGDFEMHCDNYYYGVPANRDGVFKVKINQNTIDKLKNNKAKSGFIKRIYYWF